MLLAPAGALHSSAMRGGDSTPEPHPASLRPASSSAPELGDAKPPGRTGSTFSATAERRPTVQRALRLGGGPQPGSGAGPAVSCADRALLRGRDAAPAGASPLQLDGDDAASSVKARPRMQQVFPELPGACTRGFCRIERTPHQLLSVLDLQTSESLTDRAAVCTAGGAAGADAVDALRSHFGIGAYGRRARRSWRRVGRRAAAAGPLALPRSPAERRHGCGPQPGPQARRGRQGRGERATFLQVREVHTERTLAWKRGMVQYSQQQSALLGSSARLPPGGAADAGARVKKSGESAHSKALRHDLA